MVSGATTVDFEFLKEGIIINPNGSVTSLGPDSGRTAGVVTTPVVNSGGTISKPGDIMVVTSYGGSSVSTSVYMWTKNPPLVVTFDQETNVGPYGWVLINPPDGLIFCAQMLTGLPHDLSWGWMMKHLQIGFCRVNSWLKPDLLRLILHYPEGWGYINYYF